MLDLKKAQRVGAGAELVAKLQDCKTAGKTKQACDHDTLSVTAEAMSQTLDNLERLIRIPFGCGEQNLMNMAPTAFAARYLSATGRLDSEWRDKSERFIGLGYQKEQTYMHVRTDPYSYSAFGDSDGDGSTWLTAMVIKTYAHSLEFIFIDEAILAQSRFWT